MGQTLSSQKHQSPAPHTEVVPTHSDNSRTFYETWADEPTCGTKMKVIMMCYGVPLVSLSLALILGK